MRRLASLEIQIHGTNGIYVNMNTEDDYQSYTRHEIQLKSGIAIEDTNLVDRNMIQTFSLRGKNGDTTTESVPVSSGMHDIVASIPQTLHAIVHPNNKSSHPTSTQTSTTGDRNVLVIAHVMSLHAIVATTLEDFQDYGQIGDTTIALVHPSHGMHGTIANITQVKQVIVLEHANNLHTTAKQTDDN
ncbi:unnamed protein product [Dovyalis caffra]|uniref:Uncharacterized protein n=1 Tax=Dovyalis caffra TaxID=77055 RepID=A0AAV1RP93_9ROSI|nr:unnamed protein product [Dovyalis caffra]